MSGDDNKASHPRISIPALRYWCESRGDYADVATVALLELAEAAHARQQVKGPLSRTIKERAAAEQRLDAALARFDFEETT